MANQSLQMFTSSFHIENANNILQTMYTQMRQFSTSFLTWTLKRELNYLRMNYSFLKIVLSLYEFQVASHL